MSAIAAARIAPTRAPARRPASAAAGVTGFLRADRTEPIWSSGSVMKDVMALVDRVANCDVSILLTGESGVGKEMIARELHERSARRTRPFIKVNCAALPADLLESELFGHERGAFTDALCTRVGKFESANHGTILLDEIGEMPVGLQAKLLHVLQDQSFTRLGSNHTTAVDVRVIAATNRNLTAMMTDGLFREDLYYRLQVVEICVPPLRQHAGDIPQLVDAFLARYSDQYARARPTLSDRLHEALLAYAWPGNVRELQNTIQRLVLLRDENLVLAGLQRGLPPMDSAPVAETSAAVATGPAVCAGRLPEYIRASTVAAEREVIHDALERSRWNRRKVAAELGVSYKTLLAKMKLCGITPD